MRPSSHLNRRRLGLASPRLVVCIGSAAIVILALGLLLHQAGGVARTSPTLEPRPPEAATRGVGQPMDIGAIREAADRSGPVPATAAAAEERPEESPQARHEGYVATRVNELMDLGRMRDSDSLEVILSELTNRDPRIRKAAVEAAVQFGSREAIPKLADAIVETDDPREKIALMDAIEFLKLPTLTQAVRE